jgi:hypothetical protein
MGRVSADGLFVVVHYYYFDGQGDEWIGENNLNRIHVVVSMCSV